MSDAVFVVPSWRAICKGMPRDGIVLDDEALEFVARRAGAVLCRALRNIGTDAIFNRTQIPQLISELVAAAEETGFATDIARNLFAVAEYIEQRVPPPSTLHDAYVIFLSD